MTANEKNSMQKGKGNEVETENTQIKKMGIDLLSEDGQKKYEDIHFVDSTKAVWNYSLFSDEDISNFQNGTHYRLYNFFGAHQLNVLGTTGYYFAVWAPNATYVSVIGNFNDWNNESHPLFVRLEKSGIWEGFIPNLPKGEVYKYHIHGFK